jgi:glycosyltransferase involved in cell wall biosynthesis
VRIAVIAGNREVVGGAEMYLRWLLPQLRARGHELALGFERRLVVPSRAIERDVSDVINWTLPDLGLENWLRNLEAFEPDVAYVHGISDPDIEAALTRRFNAVFYAHAYHGACATGTRCHTRPSVRVCERRFGVPCLVANFALGCGARRPDTLYRLYRTQARRATVLHEYRALAVGSAYVRETYLRQGLQAGAIHVLPCPALDLVRDAAPPVVREPSNRVLFVGRVTAVKGLHDAVRATALAQRWLQRKLALVVAGQGPELARCTAMARGLGVELESLGWVDGSQKEALYRSADALLVPSLWAEPFGIVGIEAGCVGLPSVGYPMAGIRDWLIPGISGELCEAINEPEGLARALVKALASPEHWSSLRRGAWEVAGNYTPEKHLLKLEALFELVGARSKACA